MTKTATKTGRKERIKLITPEFRVSFPTVFEAKSAAEGQKPKFSIQMLFRVKADPKKPTEKVVDISALKAAVEACAIERWGADRSEWPEMKNPTFRNGTAKDYDGYGPGIEFASATSLNRPGLITIDGQDILTPTEFYGGCYARAELTVFAYPKLGGKNTGNYGVSFGLQNLIKTRDGEPFSGRSNAADVFESIIEEGSKAEETPDVTGLDV